METKVISPQMQLIDAVHLEISEREPQLCTPVSLMPRKLRQKDHEC